MNTSNSKENNINKEEKKTINIKNAHFLDFNKNLEDLISNITSKAPSSEKKLNINISQINNNLNNLNGCQQFQINKNDYNSLFNMNLERNNQSSNNINLIKKASNRLNIDKLMGSDKFAENYILIPYINYDINYNNDLPYSKPFDDNIFLKDESIFFSFDNSYKDKFITKEDIKKIKNEEYKINFGTDPYEIYGQIYDGKISPHDKTSIEFYNSLNHFNIFKSKDPYYLNIQIANINNENGDDNFNMINNNSFNYIESEPNYGTFLNESTNSTRQNSKINSNGGQSIDFNEKEIFYKRFKKEINEIKESENEQYLGKKRKIKK